VVVALQLLAVVVEARAVRVAAVRAEMDLVEHSQLMELLTLAAAVVVAVTVKPVQMAVQVL
jgi:hypothetical protein